MKNYIYFGGFFKQYYMYFDSPEYLADSLFIKNRVTVHYGKGEWRKDGEPYVVIDCWIKRKDRPRFEKALEQLHNKMLLCGHNDYEDWCTKFLANIPTDMGPKE